MEAVFRCFKAQILDEYGGIILGNILINDLGIYSAVCNRVGWSTEEYIPKTFTGFTSGTDSTGACSTIGSAAMKTPFGAHYRRIKIKGGLVERVSEPQGRVAPF